MSAERARRLVAYLAAAEGWTTADELASRLGVTTRSVRNYAASVREAYSPYDVVETSSHGYRIREADYQAFLEAHGSTPTREAQAAARPQDRQAHLIEWLLDQAYPVDIHTITTVFFVSDSTVEADLRRVRPWLESTHLSLQRSGPDVSIEGAELDKRRMLITLYLRDLTDNVISLTDVQSRFDTPPLGPLKTRVIELLRLDGLGANEFGLGSVLLSAAVAGSRLRSGFSLPVESADDHPAVSSAVAEVAFTVLGEITGSTPSQRTQFPGEIMHAEAHHIARLFDAQVARSASPILRIRPQVAELVQEASDHFALSLDDEGFIDRLTGHINNVLERAKGNLSSPNPMTQSLKESYPLVYEVAVYLAHNIGLSFDATLDENEIAFLALHIGSYLERGSQRSRRLRCAFVCPDYYGMHLFLRDRIEEELRDILEVTSVITRTDVEWSEVDADIVLSTIPAPTALTNVVQIQPFLTEDDEERIRYRVSRIHRRQRRSRLKTQLLRYLSPELFTTNLSASNEVDAIQQLGELLVSQDVVDSSYVNDALSRERMSSTLFGDLIAVPHAMNMTANRTAIALAVTKTAIPWGESRVQIVAFVAFAADDRDEFQTVFDQLIKVFSSRDEAQQIIRSSESFESFLDALTRVMGS